MACLKRLGRLSRKRARSSPHTLQAETAISVCLFWSLPVCVFIVHVPESVDFCWDEGTNVENVHIVLFYKILFHFNLTPSQR